MYAGPPRRAILMLSSAGMPLVTDAQGTDRRTAP